MPKGLLLINLGTPDSPKLPAVRRYLRDFLSDKRVIPLPGILRYLLLYSFILPFRTPKTALAYQAIWTREGSPLRYHSEKLQNLLQIVLGKEFIVTLGMRYGEPSVLSALKILEHCETITILPLYPQYSSAATGSVIEYVLTQLLKQPLFPSIQIIRDFYQHPAFIEAQALQIAPYVAQHDHILFSYHGLPERQSNQSGYRDQCLQTTELLSHHLGLSTNFYSTGFQSRLGKTAWIKPYTDQLLPELANRGIKRLAVTCPGFVTDCLETLEEIGIRLNEQWQHLTGQSLMLIPCLNENPVWIKAIEKIIRLL